MNTAPEPSTTPVIQIPGRTCGDCAMCCKIPEIPELNKPYNSWCEHCVGYASCGAYETRPQRCRDFFCYFMLSKLGEEWRPNKSRLLIAEHPDRLLIMVDPSRPDAWKKEPYFSTLQRWSGRISVYVMLGKITYAMFPTHVDDLGEVTDNHQIMRYEEMTPNGPIFRAKRVDRVSVQ